MKAVMASRPGDVRVMRLVEQPVPQPGPGQVLIRLRAAGVNFADIMCRRAQHPGMPRPPLILGCEGTGEVRARGKGVRAFRPGSRVAVYSPPGGTYAQWICAPVSHVLPLPAGMGFEEGAAFTHVFLTAYHALRTLGRVKAGEWLLVTAAAGGVGCAVVQLARCWGVRVVAGVGSPSKEEVPLGLGAHCSLCYGRPRWQARLREVCPPGPDLILESVGGSLYRQCLRCLAPLGRLISFGMAGGSLPSAPLSAALSRSATLGTLNLSVLFASRPRLIRRSWSALLQLQARGVIRPLISARLPLHQAARAHRLMESRRSTGKMILLID